MNRIKQFVRSNRAFSPPQGADRDALLMGSSLNRVTDCEAVARRANYSVTTVAALCGVSERQLLRYIRAKLGQSPRAWLEQLRLLEAHAMLRRGEPIKVIVDVLRFHHGSHFGRAFKRKYGLTPRQYQLSVVMSEIVHDVRWC